MKTRAFRKEQTCNGFLKVAESDMEIHSEPQAWQKGGAKTWKHLEERSQVEPEKVFWELLRNQKWPRTGQLFSFLSEATARCCVRKSSFYSLNLTSVLSIWRQPFLTLPMGSWGEVYHPAKRKAKLWLVRGKRQGMHIQLAFFCKSLEHMQTAY